MRLLLAGGTIRSQQPDRLAIASMVRVSRRGGSEAWELAGCTASLPDPDLQASQD